MAHPVITGAEVLSRTTEGAYHRLVLRAPGVAARVRPGHFATLAVGGPHSALPLRRAFAVHRADPAAETVELVIAERGPGTRELARSRPGDTLDLIAPLGTPFPLPDGPVSALLVAEGHGSASLFALGEEIGRRGGQIGFILGGSTADRVFGADLARELTPDVLVVTEDGSAGLTGRITGPLAQAIRAIDATVVHSCGSAPVLREITAIARGLGVRSWTLVETPMACGTGLCMSCVLPVVGEDGVSRFVRSCTDGPVFDGARVRWKDIGAIPADLDGAAAMGVR